MSALARRVGVCAAVGGAVTWSLKNNYASSQRNPIFQPTPDDKSRNKEDEVHVLVHNLSHADLIVHLSPTPEHSKPQSGNQESVFKARPMFNQFNYVASAILSHLDRVAKDELQLQTLRSVCEPTFRHMDVGLDLECGGTAAGVSIDAGGHGGKDGTTISNPWERFHLKGLKRHDGLQPVLPQSSHPRVTAAILPLVATLLPRWLQSMDEVSEPGACPRKLLVLVAGSATPRDGKADPMDNSTERLALIVRRFVNLCFPDVEVAIISSTGGMFRYDENLKFVKEEVLPVLEGERSRIVQVHGENWPRKMHVTLSLSDGATARVSALAASLRAYRPNYLHLWRLKTFWDEGFISQNDVDLHPFNKLEMRPSVPRDRLRGIESLLAEEMIAYKRQFEHVRDREKQVDSDDMPMDTHELSSFWLRKTRKAVLAVLAAQKPGEDKPTFYRGMNVEVSMPTGSLCAERNAVGQALAADPSLKRSDLVAIAVLSITLSPPADEANGEIALNPLDPCGACMEWLRKIAEVNPDFKVLNFADTACQRVFVTPIEYLSL